MADVLGVCARHVARGMLFGALAGGGVGSVEGYLLTAGRVARAALREAAVYAVVVDCLVGAAAGALLALPLALAGALLAGRRAERPLAVAQFMAMAAGGIAVGGVLWYERLQRTGLPRARPGLALPDAPALPPAFQLAGAAVLGALLVYFLAGRHLIGTLLRWPRATSAGALALVGLVALVLPVQVVLEARAYHVHATPGRAAPQWSLAAPLPAALEPDLRGVGAPNVVLITVDALRADHLGLCGAGEHGRGLRAGDAAAFEVGETGAAGAASPTPNLDRLAAQGTLFCFAHVHQPQTNPSLASLFTGLYPASHGVRAHMTDRLPEKIPTLARFLRAAGYTTAGIAPWTSLKPAFSGLHQGFQTYIAAAIGEPEFLALPVVQGAAGVFRRVKDQLWIAQRLAPLAQTEDALEEQLEGRADVSTDHAINWLAVHRRDPFLLWVHYFDPHYPWTPPPPYDTLYDPDYVWSADDVYDGSWRTWHAYAAGEWAPGPRQVQHLRAVYKGEVRYADEQIGRLLAALDDLGLLANTLFVVTSDHGEGFGEHDVWFHGDSLYAHDIQVPLLFAGPGVPARGRVDALARQIDVLPTILELLHLPPAPEIDGRSLVPLLRGEDDGRDRVSFAQIGDDTLLAVVTGDLWKLILDYRKWEVELYYLPDDPQELDNRAAREWGRASELFRLVDRWAEAKNMHWFKLPEFRLGF